MGQDVIINTKEGSQFQPFSEETELLNTEQTKNTAEKKQSMPSFKNLLEKIKDMDYPWNQLTCFY